MQPTWLPRSARSSGESRSSATMSVIPTRPPGRRTRWISRVDRALVGRKVHDAVRDDDVDALRREGNRLDQAFEEVDVLRLRFRGVSLREREHLVRHVEPVDGSLRPDPARREQDVDAASGPQVEHGLARVQRGDGKWVAAAEAGGDRVLRQAGALLRVVEALAEERRRLVAATADGIAVAPAALSLAQPTGGLRVALPNFLAQIRAHTATPFRSRTLAARSRPSRSRV